MDNIKIKSFMKVVVKGFFTVLFSVLVVVITSYERFFHAAFWGLGNYDYTYELMYLIGLAIIVAIILLVIVFGLPTWKRMIFPFSGIETKNRSNAELRSIAVGQPQKDIFELMIQNMEEIRGYFEISKAQARKAFLFSVISFFIGLLFFVVSVLTVVQNEKIDIAIIGIIAGGITEIVSIFALHIYKKTSEQLNHYHAALQRNENYLSTVHLVSKLSPEKQEEIYVEIIRASLSMKKEA